MQMTRPPRAIIVWEFHNAPDELKALSRNGGDEDWIVVVPPGINDAYVPWIAATDTCNEPDRFELPDGSVVFIGCHA